MKDFTHITVLLDRSGSMQSIAEETITGFNQFVREQANHGANASLTLVQFDTGGVDTVEEQTPIGRVQPLNADTYQPRAMTPLLDALGTTITDTGAALERMPEGVRPDKVVFVVITDGLENASRKFTKAQVAAMIQHQTEAYQWQFVYLGANQDAFGEAGALHVGAQQAANWAATPDAVRAVYVAVGQNVNSYRVSGLSSDLHFSKRQRAQMAPEPEQPKVPKPSKRTKQ